MARHPGKNYVWCACIHRDMTVVVGTHVLCIRCGDHIYLNVTQQQKVPVESGLKENKEHDYVLASLILDMWLKFVYPHCGVCSFWINVVGTHFQFTIFCQKYHNENNLSELSLEFSQFSFAYCLLNMKYVKIQCTHFLGTFNVHTFWGPSMHTFSGDLQYINGY